ncbi:MAG: hypothetical protein SGPRY_009692, partial [Prymnesium sp.]
LCFLLLCSSTSTAHGATLSWRSCPGGSTLVDTFRTPDEEEWAACEDLSSPGGGISLVNQLGAVVHFAKSYEPYSPAPDASYYLGKSKAHVLSAKWDVLGHAILHECEEVRREGGRERGIEGEYGGDEQEAGGREGASPMLCEPTWARVERALPVIRYSQGNRRASGNRFTCSPYSPESGVRTFTGSRSSSVDASFSDHADDCTDNGFPRPQGYVMNLTAISMGEPPVRDFLQYVNFSGMAEGLVGGEFGYPNLVFYFPILKQNFSSFGGSRYWSMVASPVADMHGGREQAAYWDDELRKEGMMEISLPSTGETNGSWLVQQARFAIVRSMISRDDTWHPRYGVLPGYGISLQDGFQDTFTATATGALEWGALPYAKGVISNWLKYYVRDNGMVAYRAEELAQSGRMLVLFALYVSYSGDDALMLAHFAKAREMARWLLYRYQMSLRWPVDDPRHGIVAGGDEGDGFVAHYETCSEAFTCSLSQLYLKIAHPAFSSPSHTSPSGFLNSTSKKHTPLSQLNLTPAHRALNSTSYLPTSPSQLHLIPAQPALSTLPHTSPPRFLNFTSQSPSPLSQPHLTQTHPAFSTSPYTTPPRFLNSASHHPTLLSPFHLTQAHKAFSTSPDTRPCYLHSTSHSPTLRFSISASHQPTRRHGRRDVLLHGEELVTVAPKMLSQLRASLERTTIHTGNPLAPRCIPTGADPSTPPIGCLGDFRGTPELLYAAVLTRAQTADVMSHAMYANDTRMPTRPMTLGCTGYNNKCSTYVAYGTAYGLLLADMVEHFLLVYFAFGSAHGYTRGTVTTPEASHPDRDVGSTDYVAAGVMMAPIYLKWMLVFEDPNSRSVCLGKALPREWLTAGGQPIIVKDATTRYGRVSYTLIPYSSARRYSVHASVELPASFSPPGGLQLRLRAPVRFASKLAHVSLCGKPWKWFSAETETIHFSASELNQTLVESLRDIEAVWESSGGDSGATS